MLFRFERFVSQKTAGKSLLYRFFTENRPRAFDVEARGFHIQAAFAECSRCSRTGAASLQ